MSSAAMSRAIAIVLAAVQLAVALPQGNDEQLQSCGVARYLPSMVR